MTNYTELDEPEERWLLLGQELDYYNQTYPHSFKLKVRAGDVRLGEAHEWCGLHWGAPASRRYSHSRVGWRVRDDSTWAYYLNTFYFKEPNDCVLFQLRWR